MSEYGCQTLALSSHYFFSLHIKTVDLMIFLKVQIVCVVCIHNLNMCCWKNFTMSLKSIKIIKCLAGTASTCSMLFCQSPGCSRSFWAQSKLHNASFSGKLFTWSAVSHSLLSLTTLENARLGMVIWDSWIPSQTLQRAELVNPSYARGHFNSSLFLQ